MNEGSALAGALPWPAPYHPYADNDTPELGMALCRGRRCCGAHRRGVGTALDHKFVSVVTGLECGKFFAVARASSRSARHSPRTSVLTSRQRRSAARTRLASSRMPRPHAPCRTAFFDEIALPGAVFGPEASVHGFQLWMMIACWARRSRVQPLGRFERRGCGGKVLIAVRIFHFH